MKESATMSKSGVSTSSRRLNWGGKKTMALIIAFLFTLVSFQSMTTETPTEKPEEIKLIYILLWTPITTSPFSYWSMGRDDIVKSHCPVTNCYITNRRDLLGNITKFDALLFNGRSLKHYQKSELPKQRSSHQKYIFLNMESSDNQPICNSTFDNFFNWTATYKLSSDIVLSYLYIKDKAGKEIGPKIGMTWTEQPGVNETFKRISQTKSKAVAWFVSHCSTRSKREVYAEKLKESLRKHNLTLDVFGKCGRKPCSRSNKTCENMLNETYYFYLSFENSFAEDYITEKALNPLLEGAVPVVYGGADYSRFLPPGSYIDAQKHAPGGLADLIAHLISTPAEYQKLFWWRNHYSYHKPNYVCRLCEALNDQTEPSHVYKDFRSWWNRDYKKRCRKDIWGS